MGDELVKLNIHHAVSDIHRRDAGPSYSVTRLAEELAREHNVTLHALKPAPDVLPDVTMTFHDRLPVARPLGISPQMKRELKDAAETADILHFHGMWMMPSVYPASAVRGTDAALVMSPRGMLDPWALEWHVRRKRVFSRLLQDRALRAVDCFHATSSMEATAIRSAGYSAPIAVIPIGIDLPTPMSVSPTDYRTLLSIGRLHPKKNVDGLLRVWERVHELHHDWQLVIVGTGPSGYVEYLQGLAAGLPRVAFLGAQYGDQKRALLDVADLFVLPTHSENFGIVVAEALSHGVPVVSSSGAPWQGLTTHDAGWWIRNDLESLTHALDAAMAASDTELADMGANGRRWMEAEFQWSAIAEKTASVYQWARFGGSRPEFITT